MKLGFSRTSLKDRDILRAIKKAKELSCDLVQFTVNMRKDDFPDTDLIKKVNEIKENIELILHPIDRIPFNEKQIKEFIELAKNVDSKLIILHIFRETNFDTLINFKKLCEKNNIILAFENGSIKEEGVPGGDKLLYSIEDFQELLIKIPDMKMIFDLNHSYRSDIDPGKFYKKFKNIIIGLHVTDCGKKGPHLPIGTGEIDFKSIFDNLNNDIILILEIKGKYENVLEDSIQKVREFISY